MWGNVYPRLLNMYELFMWCDDGDLVNLESFKICKT
jgi:hypothetical protein